MPAWCAWPPLTMTIVTTTAIVAKIRPAITDAISLARALLGFTPSDGHG
jgi:hypothetical protein